MKQLPFVLALLLSCCVAKAQDVDSFFKMSEKASKGRIIDLIMMAGNDGFTLGVPSSDELINLVSQTNNNVAIQVVVSDSSRTVSYITPNKNQANRIFFELKERCIQIDDYAKKGQTIFKCGNNWCSVSSTLVDGIKFGYFLFSYK